MWTALLLVGQAAAPADLAWTLRVARAPEPRLAVEVRCAGDADGVTEFGLSEDSGGVLALGDWIAEASVHGADGAPLPVQRVASGRWEVRHPPGASLLWRHAVSANRRQEDPDPRVHYAPLVNEELIHVLGGLALPLPAHLAGAPRAVELSWEGLSEAGWSAVCPYGAGPGPHRVEMDPAEFRHAPFLAGALDLAERELHGHPVRFAVQRGAFAFGAAQLADSALPIVAAQRGFFADWERPRFLISAVPVGVRGSNSMSIGGTGLHESFAVFLPHDSRLDSAFGSMTVPRLLAHEMFHHWNGGILSLDEQPQTSFWFSEGFTDFYARRLMFRAGLLEAEAWLADVNHSLRQYAASPALHWSAERIRDAFFTDREAGSHAYRRGDVIAMAADYELSRRAGRAGGLDDFMRDLVARARRGEKISPARWFELLAERTDAAFAAHLRAVAVDGEPLRMPEDFGFPEFRLEAIEIHAYELGFDFPASVSGPGIVGVVEGSAAHRAGLRNGMRLAGFAGGDADPDAPVRVTVLDASGQRLDLEWLPRGATRPGWRLAPRDD